MTPEPSWRAHDCPVVSGGVAIHREDCPQVPPHTHERSIATARASARPTDPTVKDLAEVLAGELENSAPEKVEGGSDARRQWLADVLAVQGAFHAIGRMDTFMVAFNPPSDLVALDRAAAASAPKEETRE